eukprot:s1070_g20.t1
MPEVAIQTDLTFVKMENQLTALEVVISHGWHLEDVSPEDDYESDEEDCLRFNVSREIIEKSFFKGMPFHEHGGYHRLFGRGDPSEALDGMVKCAMTLLGFPVEVYVGYCEVYELRIPMLGPHRYDFHEIDLDALRTIARDQIPVLYDIDVTEYDIHFRFLNDDALALAREVAPDTSCLLDVLELNMFEDYIGENDTGLWELLMERPVEMVICEHISSDESEESTREPDTENSDEWVILDGEN